MFHTKYLRLKILLLVSLFGAELLASKLSKDELVRKQKQCLALLSEVAPHLDQMERKTLLNLTSRALNFDHEFNFASGFAVDEAELLDPVQFLAINVFEFQENLDRSKILARIAQHGFDADSFERAIKELSAGGYLNKRTDLLGKRIRDIYTLTERAYEANRKTRVFFNGVFEIGEETHDALENGAELFPETIREVASPIDFAVLNLLYHSEGADAENVATEMRGIQLSLKERLGVEIPDAELTTVINRLVFNNWIRRVKDKGFVTTRNGEAARYETLNFIRQDF